MGKLQRSSDYFQKSFANHYDYSFNLYLIIIAAMFIGGKKMYPLEG